jgi:hypothetical protein
MHSACQPGCAGHKVLRGNNMKNIRVVCTGPKACKKKTIADGVVKFAQSFSWPAGSAKNAVTTQDFFMLLVILCG